VFIKVGYDSDFDTVMMYLWSKYGKELFDIDGIGKQLDQNLFAKEFFKNKTTTADASVDSNSNVATKDVIAYNYEASKPFQRYNSYFLLWQELRDLYDLQTANQILEDQLVGRIYINDFHSLAKPYCFNYSCYDIALGGLQMGAKVRSLPPKSLFTFKSQIEQFVVNASQSTAGATGLADLLICMAYYIDKILEFNDIEQFVSFRDFKEDCEVFEYAIFRDGNIVVGNTEEDVWTYVRETLTSLIYGFNFPMRGAESPFVNISVFDDNFLESLVKDYKFKDGAIPTFTTVENLQRVYLEVMNEELRRAPITFPVTTACFTVNDEGEIQDEGFLKLIAEENKKYGFINIYCGKSSTLSSCCRLRSDTRNEYFNSFGSGSTKIGSLGVCTINLPRLVEETLRTNPNDFPAVIHEICLVAGKAVKINAAKRSILADRIARGALPLYDLGYMELSKQYSTIGITGLYEAVELLGHSIVSETGQNVAERIIRALDLVSKIAQKRHKTPHNIEQVPAESSAIKLATKDKYLGFNKANLPFYSNQFIPLQAEATLLERLEIQGKFDGMFSGGAICHVNVEERIEDVEDMEKLIRMAAKRGVIYWAVNYNLQECENGHMTVGRKDTCNICKSPIINNFTRIVGFLTNTKHWAAVRREKDYPNRQFYKGVS